MSTLSHCMYIYIINKIYLLGEICPVSPKFGDACLKKQTNKTKNTKKRSICQFPNGDWNYTLEYRIPMKI